MPYNLEALLNLVVKPRAAFERTRVEAFVARWKQAPGGNEDANSKPFFTELFELFGQKPTFNAEGEVSFEKHVLVPGEPGAKRIDVYKRGTFVIEAKQGSSTQDKKDGIGRRGTRGYEKEMKEAFLQGLRYAQNVPEGLPPVLMVADVAYSFHVWTSFGGNFRGWGSHGLIMLDELIDEATFHLLYDLLTEPQRRDPQRAAARVTKEVAGRLGELAQALEQLRHDPGLVARFLMRCVFTMFAEDIGILEGKPFETALRERWSKQPELFVPELEAMWNLMDKGGTAFGLGRIPHINGALFAEATAIPLAPVYMAKLLEAARADWTQVEPSIFGTLLERALDEKERHKLGAHYTPRAYIERLVWHTVITPLRAEWQEVQAQITVLINTKSKAPSTSKKVRKNKDPLSKDRGLDNETIALLTKSAEKTAAAASLLQENEVRIEAQKLAIEFRTKLSSIRILDPACGSGNFLYVTFDLLKELEKEVLKQLIELGWEQQTFGFDKFSVTPVQFFGIEIKPWARQVAELTLWIGALQWWFRLHPNAKPPEPILKDHKQIINRDAILNYSSKQNRIGDNGRPETIWDQESFKKHPVTDEMVPDNTKQKPIYNYIDAAAAEWPQVDYIVGNPPFIGKGERMRIALGDGYVEALRNAWPDVPSSTDLVMYWWQHSAQLLHENKIKGFGFITTNSLTQIFNRRVVEHWLKKGNLHISYAIPDHPWIDSSNGAAVRIAMTVAHCGVHEGTLDFVVDEQQHNADDIAVITESRRGPIHADLKIGPNVSSAKKLRANKYLSSNGVSLHGAGFLITQEKAKLLGLGSVPGLEKHIRHYRNGRDLTSKSRDLMVIDLQGLSAEAVAAEFPLVYQHLYENVKPERDINKEKYRRENWWVFGRKHTDLRKFLFGLPRYIATVETAKHRLFVFLDTSILPDHRLIAFGLDDAYYLGVLSSRVHVVWAIATGGTLEDRPVYNKTKCVDNFPFPEPTEDLKAKIRVKAELLDAHRKKVMEKNNHLELTEIYNVLDLIKEGKSLNEKQKNINKDALISSQLIPTHEEIDQLVAMAYKWPEKIGELSDEEILFRLVELNHQRTVDEEAGHIRWLRPDFQAPHANALSKTVLVEGKIDNSSEADENEETAKRKWPSKIAGRIQLLRSQIEDNPGQTAEWHASRITGVRVNGIKEVLDALSETGVAFNTTDYKWFVNRK
jgi:hypothetical protein